MLESLFHSTAFGFMNIYVVLPTFADHLTEKAILVGLVTTVMEVSLNLPQIITGNIVAGTRRKKPIMVVGGILGRSAFLLLALVIALTGARPAWVSLLALYLALLLFFGSDSIVSVARMDILKRSFPREKRGGYMSIWKSIATLVRFGAALLVTRVFADDRLRFPDNYQLLFTLGGVTLALSIIGFLLIYEKPDDGAVEDSKIPWNSYVPELVRLWKQAVRLRRITLVRLCVWLSQMAFPFYVIYATEQLKMPQAMLGTFVLVQSLSTPLFSPLVGYLINKHGAYQVSKFGTLILIVAPITALIFSMDEFGLTEIPQYLFLMIYICIGQFMNIGLAYTNFIFDIAPDGQTSLYYGLYNSVSSLGLIAPLLAGWILDVSSYQVLFGAALLFGTLAFYIASKMNQLKAFG